jgi:glyoxylase-like metal-dependent hydrolase (beta-lactamase superfamily II)
MAYALIGRKVVLVDTGIGDQANLILSALAQKERAPQDVSLILLTHGHGDHAGSAEALREATGAPIALGAGDQEKCSAGFDDEMHARGFLGRVLLRAIRRRQAKGSATPGPQADIVIDRETSLSDYGVSAVVFPLPGHTRGSLAVMTEEGDALVGDLLGGGGRSRSEPRRGVFAHDDAVMDASIRQLLTKRPRLTYTGHDAAPFTLDQLEAAFRRTPAL